MPAVATYRLVQTARHGGFNETLNVNCGFSGVSKVKLDPQTDDIYIIAQTFEEGTNALLHKNLKSLLGCTVERGNNRLGMKSFSIDCVCSMYMYCMCVFVCTCLPIEINRVMFLG